MAKRSILLGLLLLIAPLAAEAQPAGRVWRIGYLGATTPTPANAHISGELGSGLRDLGYVEGRNLIMERRYADGRNERYGEFAAEFVRLNVDLIVALNTPAARAASQATSTIPIVTILVGDHVAAGLASSLARPGANVTGLSNQAPDIVTKHLQLVLELIPRRGPVLVFWNPTLTPHVVSLRALRAAVSSLPVEIRAVEVRSAQDLEVALSPATAKDVAAFLPFEDPATFLHRRRIIDFAARHRLPAIYLSKVWVDDGGLMSYGPSLVDQFRRAAAYVDRIFKGARPGELPIEQPTKFEFVLSLKTARALGLSIPPSLRAQADEVIE